MWSLLSNLSNDDVPQFLESLDLPGIAKFMKSDSCKNVFVMAGAALPLGYLIFALQRPVSTQALSNPNILIAHPKTLVIQANLARLNLPYPEAVFDISFFKRNPRPFYVLAHELAPGKFRPTLTHSFIRLLAEKGLLHTCFTQNIDTLERVAGVPPDKIIEAHGSFADQHCVDCGAEYPHDKIKKNIEKQEIPICKVPGCGGYVKPDIVFFGESLPEKFFHGIRHLRDADLLLVMGTSLTVHPFASLTELVPEECARVLVNLDHVGGWGSRTNDVACLMSCDKAVRELSRLLGWEEELDKLWAETDTLLKNLAPAPEGDSLKAEITRRVQERDETKEAKEKGQTEEEEGQAKAEVKTEETEGQMEEEEETETTKVNLKNAFEDLLQDVIDKLAENIGDVKLEDEEESTREDSGQKVVEDSTTKALSKPEFESVNPDARVTSEKADSNSSPAAKSSELESAEQSSTTPPSSSPGKV